jgi:hypothetical protein
LEGVVGVSTFALLFYYAMANIAAFKLDAKSRVYPRFVCALGLASCLLLLPFTKARSLIAAALCFMVGIFYHSIRVAWRGREHGMIVRYLLAWVAMPLLGIGNAVIRELTCRKYVGELLAHQISTLTGIVFFALYIGLLPAREQERQSLRGSNTIAVRNSSGRRGGLGVLPPICVVVRFCVCVCAHQGTHTLETSNLDGHPIALTLS